jgi:hypothetical protein
VIGHHGKGSVTRRCTFCHGEIDASAPPEHVIPKWIGREYPNATFTRHDRQGRPIRSKTIDITVDTVCEDCNHHWMSDLEAAASPMLKPMLKGTRLGLTVQQQALLAQWATKTAMTLDQGFVPRERVFSPGVCKQLMERKLPPVGTGVQLAHYIGTGDFLTVVHNDLYRRGIPVGTRPGTPDGHRTAIRIDKLILEVNMPEDATTRISHPDIVDIRDVLVRVWPSTDTTIWPPRYSFGEQTWESFVAPDTRDPPE